jgi:hypothetical protein
MFPSLPIFLMAASVVNVARNFPGEASRSANFDVYFTFKTSLDEQKISTHLRPLHIYTALGNSANTPFASAF